MAGRASVARTEKRNIRVRGLVRPLRIITRRNNGHSILPDTRVGDQCELEYNGLRWIDIRLDPNRPDQTVVDKLGERFGFHELALDDILSKVQRPKLDDYDTYLFLVMHFPRFNRVEKVAESSEVDFFLGPDYVITIHSGDLPPLLRMWARLEADEEARVEYMDRGAELLLYHIVDGLTNYLFPMMNRIDKNLDRLDGRIFGDRPRGAVRDLATYRRDIISLRRIIRPGMLVVSTLENGRASLLNEEFEPYWSDIADHFDRIWDMLGEFKEEVEAFDDTFNTLYSYQTNETLRALTLISVILLPLTLITGFFGMNVPLPFGLGDESNYFSFFFIAAAMMMLSAAMLWFFRRKGWW